MNTRRSPIQIKNKQDCCGCYACYNCCPVHAISMRQDAEGFWYPEVHADTCVRCGLCATVCPFANKPDDQTLTQAYACYAKDPEEHKTSSSGGVFAILARDVLAEEGVVCGAAFDEAMQVNHLCITSYEELKRLKGSKYVQSRIGNVYSEIRRFLMDGKKVLFSGTACQVAGLKNYLKRDYENLLCVDLICHGVSSPKVWERYLKELKPGCKIVEMSFRNKSRGISDVTLDYKASDGTLI